MIMAISGPMKSGKTSKTESIVKAQIFLGKKVEIYDFLNSRNSKRDLKTLFETEESVHFANDYSLPNRPTDLFVFDEIHFVNVFGKEKEFMALICSIMELQKKSIIVISGLFYNYYDNYNPFHVWELIGKLPKLEFTMLYSLTPCAICGENKRVYFSKSDGTTTSIVGDHYVNICQECAGKERNSI